MAFSHPDTDAWFDKSLVPVLKRKGVSARRVDRLEHNDDIDDRILQELEGADFVLADLTYARPSVYFEAGYAQRVIPVIYTCRADHLEPPRESWRLHSLRGWSDGKDKQVSPRRS
jgi:nucleoside 2-deoxyribosyltransferase